MNGHSRVAWSVWSVLLLAASTWSLTNLIRPGPWLAWPLLLAAVMAALGVALQHGLRRRPRLTQETWVGGALVLTAVDAAVRAAAPDDMALGVVPTPTALAATVQSFVDAWHQVARDVPPVADATPYLPLVVLGIGLVAVIVVIAAVVWRSGAMAAAGALAPWCVALVMRWDCDVRGAVLAGSVVLAFLIWQAWPSRSGRRAWAARLGGAAVILAGALALALSAVAIAPGMPRWGEARPWLQSFRGSSGVAGQAIGIDGFSIDRQLLAGGKTPRLRLTGDYAGPLKLATMTDFDGRSWLAADTSDQTPVAPGQVLWPGDVTATSYPTTLTTRITVLTDSPNNVPLASGPRQVTPLPGGQLQYSPSTDTAYYGPGATTFDEQVQVLDRATLNGDQAASPADPGTLDVPETSHLDDLRRLSQQLTAGTRGPLTDYEKLIAIQDYLTSNRFRYTLTPNYGAASDDAVWEFLQRRTGYCVHFATAMIVLGRLAGVPMRAAVGYTTPGPAGVVTDQNAHMWPQAQFTNAGWVDFEPTRAAAGSAVPATTAPSTSATQTTSTAPSTSATAATSAVTSRSSAGTSPTPAHTTTPGQTTSPGKFRPSLPAGIGVGAVAVVAALAGGLFARRRWVGRWTPERAWAGVTRAARRRRLVRVGTTPRGVVDALAPRLGPVELELLDTLAQEIETRRYAPPRDAPDDTVRSRRWHDMETSIVRGLRGGRHRA